MFLPPTAQTGEALVQCATNTRCPPPPGPPMYRAGAHGAPTVNSGEIPAALTGAGIHLTAPDDVGCFHFSVITRAELLCPQGKPLPVCSTWSPGKRRCASRTSICSLCLSHGGASRGWVTHSQLLLYLSESQHGISQITPFPQRQKPDFAVDFPNAAETSWLNSLEMHINYLYCTAFNEARQTYTH